MTTTPNRPTIAQRANRFAVAAALVFGMAVGCNYSPDDAPTALVGCDREAGPCAEGQITGVDLDGRLMIAQDLNGDGVIAGDVELGS